MVEARIEGTAVAARKRWQAVKSTSQLTELEFQRLQLFVDRYWWNTWQIEPRIMRTNRKDKRIVEIRVATARLLRDTIVVADGKWSEHYEPTLKGRKLSLPEIGRLMNLHHTTVLHLLRKTEPAKMDE